MSDKSNIEWTEATWNPIAGCDLVSPGCTNCYAMRRVAPRLPGNPATPHYAGTVKPSKAGPVWTGKIGIASDKVMTKPLRWTRPRMIFVNSTSDLFHPGVPDEVIDRVFAVMALSPQHTFQILTKRAERMRSYLSSQSASFRVAHVANRDWRWQRVDPNTTDHDKSIEDIQDGVTHVLHGRLADWPLPNVWLGVSVEDHTRADERIPILLDTPAAVRWLSAEPLLGPIDLRSWLPGSYECAEECGWRSGRAPGAEFCRACGIMDPQGFGEFCSACGSGDIGDVCPECEANVVHSHPDTANLDWVVAGGESGSGSRPMHPDWARSIRDQCAAAGVPFLFKQWGEWVSAKGHPAHVEIGHVFDDGYQMINVGKKAAGRELDGVTHDAFPAPTHGMNRTTAAQSDCKIKE